MAAAALTYGEKLVRTAFNPSASDDVTKIKDAAAALINLISEKGKDGRTTAIAVRCFEEGAMWAVKSVTTPPTDAATATATATDTYTFAATVHGHSSARVGR